MSWMDESHFLEMWYEKTQNPYFVWSAYKFFRASNRPVPKWVLKYLDAGASQLLSGMEPMNALEFAPASHKNILSEFYTSVEHVHIVTEYVELIETSNAITAKQLLANKYRKDVNAIEQILLDAVQPESS